MSVWCFGICEGDRNTRAVQERREEYASEGENERVGNTLAVIMVMYLECTTWFQRLTIGQTSANKTCLSIIYNLPSPFAGHDRHGFNRKAKMQKDNLSMNNMLIKYVRPVTVPLITMMLDITTTDTTYIYNRGTFPTAAIFYGTRDPISYLAVSAALFVRTTTIHI